jgi:hypothetical protein
MKMALKLTILLAMFAGLVGYAQSAPLSEAAGPSLTGYKKMFAKAGYALAAETDMRGGALVDIFEMKVSSRPGYHKMVYIDVTSRDNHVLTVAHHEARPEESD